MKSTLLQFLSTLTGNQSGGAQEHNFNKQIQYYPTQPAQIEYNQYYSVPAAPVESAQMQQMNNQQLQQYSQQPVVVQNTFSDLQNAPQDYFGVNQEDTFQELNDYLGSHTEFDTNQYLSFNNDYLSLPPLPLGKEFCLDEEWKSLFTN